MTAFVEKEARCVHCANAVPNEFHGCPWSRELKPVEGWDAEDTVFYTQWTSNHRTLSRMIPSYKVRSCPMFVPDEERRTGLLDEAAVEKLACAIVKQAADDYRACRRVRSGGYVVDGSGRRGNRYELEKFFRSAWCGVLSGGLGRDILRRLQKGE